jgi:O-antigen/teichoic acid export membrane protein
MKALLLLHLGMSLLFAFVLCVSAAVVSRLGQGNGLTAALLSVAFASLTYLLFGLTKRIFYLKLSPAPSVAAAFLYCLLTMGGLGLAYRQNHLSASSAFLIMGFGGLGTSIVLLAYLASRLSSSEPAPGVLDTWRRHWRYGRWALGANAAMWVPINAFYPLLSKFSGVAQAGELKALMNFASPMLQTCAALHTLILPYSARVLHARGNAAGTGIVLRRMTLLFASCAALYWASLLLFQGTAFRILYSGRYMEVTYLLPVVALASVAGSAFFGPSIVLRSMESPSSIFAAVSVSSCVSIAIGVPLTHAWGLAGAVWSIVLSETLAFVAAVVLLRRKTRLSCDTAADLVSLPANQ